MSENLQDEVPRLYDNKARLKMTLRLQSNLFSRSLAQEQENTTNPSKRYWIGNTNTKALQIDGRTRDQQIGSSYVSSSSRYLATLNEGFEQRTLAAVKWKPMSGSDISPLGLENLANVVSGGYVSATVSLGAC